MKNFPQHYKTAVYASIEASEEILRIYSLPFQNELKEDGSPITEADLAASTIISTALATTNIPIIGEETEKSSYSIRQHWKEVWIVDPLDGTKEFIKKNGEFAVNIALVEDRIPIFGIIAHPVNQRVLLGGKAIGVYCFHFNEVASPEKWVKLEPKALNHPLKMISSRSHFHSNELDFIETLKQNHEEITFIKKGSSLKFFDLAFGDADVYPRFAPTMEWDIAAGQAILEALGGVVEEATTNKPLEYNKEDLYNPFFIAKTKAFLLEHA